MIDSPFCSEVFKKIWLKNFNKDLSRHNVQGIEGIEFYKTGLPGVYHNIGRTHTKGIYYELNQDTEGLKGTCCLVFDVPAYFGCPEKKVKGKMIMKVRQYPGFLIELDRFTNLSHYLREQFGKSSRYKLNKYRKKLEQSFNISAKMFTGEMDQKEFDQIFDKFRELLEKRFSDKEEYNNNLDKQEWDFYKEVAYPMILQNKAGLFVIFDGDQPIAVTLNYFSKDIIFDAITVFDIDYFKFHLGSVNIMYLIEWGIANKFKILDFSKGYFDYKTRWSTKRYDFEYHLIYDRSSIKSAITAYALQKLFALKQYLREKEINKLKNRIHFLFGKNKEHSKKQVADINLQFEDFEGLGHTLKEIGSYGPEIKKSVFEYLYLFGESFTDVKLYRVLEKENLLVLKGLEHEKMIEYPEPLEF